MEVNVNKLRQSVRWLREHVAGDSLPTADERLLKKFSQLDNFTETDLHSLLQWLSEHLLDARFTEQIAVNFEEFLLLILSKSITYVDNEASENFSNYQQKCFALAKLQRHSMEARRYATNYFRTLPAPFHIEEQGETVAPPKKKVKKTKNNNLTLLKCCYQLLSVDPAYYKELWNWSSFVEHHLKTKNELTQLEQLYFNNILAILTNMSSKKLSQLNGQINASTFLEFDEAQSHQTAALDFKLDVENAQVLNYNFESDCITNIEGVLLPVFDKENHKFYAQTDGVYEQIVKVDSTKVNLRSLALGIAAAKTICLSGPVGCGKTTLVQYLARKTGRICPKSSEINEHRRLNKENSGKQKTLNGNANKSGADSLDLEESLTALLDLKTHDTNGFLRIQLGDQTDSKMLLGQYRCTDVPGEFIWLPGILTQAVMNGYWLLLEDLDAATQDTYTILSGLLENNYLSVPGFRDYVKIQPGFQLFVTVRTNKSSTNASQKALFTLLEKYLYTINILPLSRNELCKVISTNYPKLATVANRIVDVFLTFSSGDHNIADNLRQQEIGDKADNTEKFIALPFEAVSLAAIPNAGRLVSTRDLIKLCQRSNPVFSVTSTECAYFVFQNAVDVFCSNLPQGKEKTKLIVSIGAKLGIIQSRCEVFANDYKPEINIDAERIKVGRAELYAKGQAVACVDKHESDDDDDEEFLKPKQAKRPKLTSQVDKPKILPSSSTFSFTRLAICLLERIAVCVAHAEPVLLVGETGVGKTSAVQYLAERTAHKLVVVNMNNQSDVADLVGGFKPVDLSYVLLPLRQEFESIFCETYDAFKNAAFLSKLATCYNQQVFKALVKMMIKVTDNALQTKNTVDTPAEVLKLQPRWQQLKAKLLKLDTQLAKSINISFAFIPGSLVNCIKNGDWVLLDEINLASAETLECLSTILEPDGSIVLLEKGDFTPVQRHRDFRIFACMNPNTDVGKKDLPVGIRNRFTEFFVDELTTDNDLSLLVSDYLTNSGIQRKSVSNIVKLYKKLRQLARLELNDGLGNRPVYSLRTLCRALRICAKNLCGSIERNLYESFCLSFLTQLDAESHKFVLGLIKVALLSNEKAVLRQAIPKPNGDYMDFEGYWIQQGPKELQACEHYILTESVKANLKDLARIISIGKLPVLLQGPTSAGKTSLIEYVAKRSGNHCLRINNHEHTDLQEYIGTYVADISGKLKFHEGVLVQAMRNGYWIILDELNLASTEILEALNRVLDDNRELFIPETQCVVKAHSNFMLFATQNPPGLYGGRKTLSRAFKNRFIELHFGEIPRPELEIILEKRCLIPPTYAKKMVTCMADLQKNRKTTSKNVFTLRDLFRWGNRYTYADKQLLDDQKYDWNQHLVEEGYLVLSAKVRTQLELEIIEQALYQHFKKRIDLARLFDVSAPLEHQSLVTANILTAIKQFKSRLDIVWTRNMTRMAVLTAKALEFDEPVLLVGPTGCGKTTVCQLLASINDKNLRILNCHMHTEGADFLGGLRPCRQSQQNEQTERQLFEWADGPLIQSMAEGNYFMADEISLAEDSVLERLNCVLEPERTILLAEKGGLAVDDNINNASDFVVQAKQGFQFLATMNPGGDFGKKELSPALRNRFTEIWCLPSDSKEDLIQIASNCMRNEYKTAKEMKNIENIAAYLVEIVLYIKENVEKFKFSVRDILAWANFIKQNENLSFAEQAIFGLETIFLDALEMLPHESSKQIEKLSADIKSYAVKQAKMVLNEQFTLKELEAKRGQEVVVTEQEFGLQPFLIKLAAKDLAQMPQDFSFKAPTTKRNLFRLLSALSLNKPILLEGPPGVGKTSTVENLAKAIGYKIVRINLCEHTDLADLFGTDLPAEDNVLNLTTTTKTTTTNSPQLGAFSWRDGPLLAALKADATWILLDELNLAPQSVLEGLNAILDHRGEVYIPELNKSFSLNTTTRIFACQNPLKQGGGRKGLPQSFLNRFNKVYLRKLTIDDLLYVVNEKYVEKFEHLKQKLIAPIQSKNFTKNNIFELYNSMEESENVIDATHNFDFDLSSRLVRFSEQLDYGVANLEFGYKGGPYEFNLRDILRWCDFLMDPETGIAFNDMSQANEKKALEIFKENFQEFLQKLFDTMKLVYVQRMRTQSDQAYIQNTFGRIFLCDVEKLNEISSDVSLYWTDEFVYLNDLSLSRDAAINGQQLRPYDNQQCSPLLLSSQREQLQNIIACVKHQKPLLLCGPTDTGKSKLADALCTVSNQICNTDNIDDSVTGSFQQIDLNRHLENLSQNVESLLWTYIQELILSKKENVSLVTNLLGAWYEYIMIGKSYKLELNKTTSVSKELLLFRKRVDHLKNLTDQLSKTKNTATALEELKKVKQFLELLARYASKAETLNMGGSFEWVDSKIVKSIKYGQYIALEHVNLCSSAVLDRLNPLFEPNGSLLLSEKGVTANAGGDTAEILEKSPNFRAFLTIDPKNGELSRAMRNRCVELYIHKDAYSVDDLRQLVHANGLQSDIKAINCLLRMHNSIKCLTEINNYNVSHLNQCAFLVVAYKRIGYATARAIYVAGMEVYVYSANMDLMGYGLTYYQNKLRDIVLEHMKLYVQEVNQNQVTTEARNDYLVNLTLNCGKLNRISFVKLLTTPLEILLQTTRDKQNDLALYFEALQNFENLSLISNSSEFLRFYIYLLYETSNFEDLELRYLQLERIFKSENSMALLALSKALYESVQSFKLSATSLTQTALPWNTKLYPRLRHIYDASSTMDNFYQFSSILVSRLVLQNLPEANFTTLSKISALNYSRALSQKLVTDKSKNVFLTLLAELLSCLRALIEPKLQKSAILVEDFVILITKLLWFNRMLNLAQQEIFIKKEINSNLVDKLVLHYEWLCKHLLSFLSQITNEADYRNFNVLFQHLDEYVTTVKPKMNRLRKFYVKHMMAFPPYYKQEQIRLQNLAQQLDNLLCVIPTYGTFTIDEVQRKLKAQQSTAAVKALTIINQAKIADIEKPNVNSFKQAPNIMLEPLQKYTTDIVAELNIESTPQETDLNNLEEQIKIIRNEIQIHDDNIIEETEQHINQLELGLLSLRELYLTRTLLEKVDNISTNDIDNWESLNESYCQEIYNLDAETWQLLHLYDKNGAYANLLNVLSKLFEYIAGLKTNDVAKFQDLVSHLAGNYKAFNAIWRSLLYKTYKQQMQCLATHLNALQHRDSTEINADFSYEGPALVNNCLSLLFQADGSFKPVPLKDLNMWQRVLTQMRQLIWQNAFIATPGYNQVLQSFRLSCFHAKKLLLEVKSNDDTTFAADDYLKLLEQLNLQLTTASELGTQCFKHEALKYQALEYQTALLNALIGAVELATLVATPLIDPVEKQRLKKVYLAEDIDCLTNLRAVYDLMRIVLKYKNFGVEIYEQICKQLRTLESKTMKQTKSVALRPPAQCLYSKLVQDIQHFFKTNCEPASLLRLLNLVQSVWLKCNDNFNIKALDACREVSAKLSLWVANGQHFVCHVLKPYAGYYEDFLKPLQCAVQQFSFGLIGLKSMLSQMEHALSIEDGCNLNQNAHIQRLIANFAEFPNTRVLKVAGTQTLSTNTLLNNSRERLRMLQIKIDALSKNVNIAKQFSDTAFDFFEQSLAEYNEIWQVEEEQHKQLKAADESLYVHKTKCENEDEDLMELQEIELYFPTQVDEDYGDYLEADTLEQKQQKSAKPIKKPLQLFDDVQSKVLVENFMELLELYAPVSYYQCSNKNADEIVEFYGTAKSRLQTFVTLYERHKRCLNTWLDEQAYNAICLAITMQQDFIKQIPTGATLKSPTNNKNNHRQQNEQSYNFYKDANVPEIIACMDLLARIRDLAQVQLDLYPEHATLIDIQQIIARIIQLPSNAPLVRFSTGFQLLRQKLSQWNELAHKNNHLRHEEIELAEYVQKWMRLELQCWRNCLNQTQTQIEMRAYRYWFFIYNLITEHIQGNEVMDNTLIDIKYAEKRFGELEILDKQDIVMPQGTSKISSTDVIRILRQFIEASNYGDFHVRLRLLQSFELYLQCKQSKQQIGSELENLIFGLRNLQIYFAQFANEIAEAKQTMRAPIEKKLKEFVKIESYNKDLSYFSMRNNVARVHRNLSKFLKDYRQQLEQKITAVFQPQDATVKDYTFENNKGKALRYDSKVKYNLQIDVKHFMASIKLQANCKANNLEFTEPVLLTQLGRRFMTARNVVKTTLQNAAYAPMIMAMDELLTSQLERCEHLRNLNVDRTKERPKQIIEAKQILQQKRKALTDLFKQLTQLGISYKAGLMEQTLNAEFVDYTLPAFCVRNMICCAREHNQPMTVTKEKQAIYANMLHLNENLERYYAKSVFKLKLLQNIMLKPLSELGPPNIERIKGFAAALFLHVQQQRQLLSQTTCDSYELKLALQRLKRAATLSSTTGALDQPKYVESFEMYKQIVCHIRFVLLQFKDLLDCVPLQPTNAASVYDSDLGLLTKESPQYQQLKKLLEQLLVDSRRQLEDLSQCNADLLSYEQVESFERAHKTHVKHLINMKEICKLCNKDEYLPLAKPLTELLNYIEHIEARKASVSAVEVKNIDFKLAENELANVVHEVLLSLQRLYKEHVKLEIESEKAESPKKTNAEDEMEESELQAQHLKTLHKALETDWLELKVIKIKTMLENALDHVATTMDAADKVIYIKKLSTIVPLLEQYNLMAEYQLLQQLGAHKVSAKMLSTMLTVFVEISTKGFCVPPDLLQDEQGQKKQEQKDGEEFGLEDGTGEKDASDKIESEDQLDDAKRPEDRKKENEEDKNEDCKEEKGIEMSEDFDGKMQDIEKPENEEDDSGESEDEDDVNKEMGETEEGAEKLDEQIWGDDEQPEPEPEPEDMPEEDDGKGTKDEKDEHNNLDAKNDAAKNKDDTDEHDKNGLDATNEPSEQDQRKQQKQDIDNIKDQEEVNEDQDNPYHNELEEPPEPEEMDLGDMNNDENEADGDGDNEDNDNPFDIDSMKQNMPEPNEIEDADENENKNDEEDESKQVDDSDTDESDGEQELKQNKGAPEEELDENNEAEKENEEPDTQKRGENEELDDDKVNDDETEKDAEKQNAEKPEEHAPSQDKSSKEENIQSMPNTDDKASADQAPKEDEEDKNIKQEQKLDEQDTGEEKEGVGQAENEENDGGHQGIAETKETVSKEDRKNEQKTKEKRKQGRTNEERTLGEAEKNKLKQLKTIDKLKDEKENKEQDSNEPEDGNEQDEAAEEYQHVKEPKNSDKTTLDNATEEQSKQIQHQEDETKADEENEDEADELNDQSMDVDEIENKEEEDLETIEAERNEKKTDKSSKTERTKEPAENQEQVEIEGEIIQTMTVTRGDDTTAHTNKEILLDTSTLADDMSAAELLEMRKLYQQQFGARSELPQHEHYETWQLISNRMSQNARELCEQLRLILEPTKCTRLKGDYRTGRRINMKKIIPYIASQFRKDKIWLRRTKPAQRDYKITIAIDDSKSMHHNNSKTLTLEAISLVSQALTLLESGRLSVVSFGEAPKILLNHTEQFDGPKLVNSLNFAQDKTKIAELLDFIRTVNTEEGAAGSSDNGLFENLLLVMSDGRNIYSEGKTKVRNAVKLARLQRIFLVYIIIDNPENKDSILDIQTMEMLPDSRINIKSYLDDFPFPYYVIVRDLNQLPLVLSEAMRQWFELVNSEQ